MFFFLSYIVQINIPWGWVSGILMFGSRFFVSFLPRKDFLLLYVFAGVGVEVKCGDKAFGYSRTLRGYNHSRQKIISVNI